MQSSPSSLSHLLTVVATLFLVALLLQIPLVVVYAPSKLVWLNLGVHFGMTVLVIYLIKQTLVKDARLLLVTTFLTFLTGSALLWQTDLFIQHFLLIGCLVTGFIYRKTEALQSYFWGGIYAFVFLILDNVYSSELVQWQHNLRQGNSVTLALSCICIIAYLHKHTANRWSLLSSQYKNTRQVLHKTVPLTQLVTSPKTNHRKDLSFACVLFADIKGYQKLTWSLDKNTLFTLLDTFYQSFDQSALSSNVLPIKTNGDEYMAASGLTEQLETKTACAEAILEFAFTSHQQFTQVVKAHGIQCQLRIGISAGPVSAGLPNRALAHFDLWGATVNNAASLEQSAPANHLCICETLYSHLSPFYQTRFSALVVTTKAAELNAYVCRLNKT